MTLAVSAQRNARMTSAPPVIGKTIVRIVKARRPRTRYRVGFGAVPTGGPPHRSPVLPGFEERF
ncbi:short chain dehydrogenase [Streptomyces sp. MP131-18]|nr:short chain dehydrogenase [Streptomyces sp. MP131-18]